MVGKKRKSVGKTNKAKRKQQQEDAKEVVVVPVVEEDDNESDDSSASSEEEENMVMSIDQAERAAADEDSGDDDDDNDGKNGSGDEDGDDDSMEDKTTIAAAAVTKKTTDHLTTPRQSDDEHCTYDLRNLLVMNGHQVDLRSLYEQQQNDAMDGGDDECCIPLAHASSAANEEFLLKKVSEGCQKLISELWTLPTEKTDVGPLFMLPSNFVVALPRELPPPSAKSETTWEKFAKERGIGPKGKRSRKEYDEATDSWKYLTGYEKANSKTNEWPIMEVGANDDPYADPWEKQRDEKRGRLEKNLENRMRNQEQQGLLVKGTATRTLKDKRAATARGKEAHHKGNTLATDNKAKSTTTVTKVPSGVPVDLKPGKLSGNVKPLQRGKDLTKQALLATQRSTASLGKFDRLREGEPERKHPIRKRRYDPVEATQGKNSSESERGLKVLDRVLNGGKQKDLDVRRGKYAKGETAYDYEFDDGLGQTAYKKKKGRAGAGKLKKVTKKRAK